MAERKRRGEKRGGRGRRRSAAGGRERAAGGRERAGRKGRPRGRRSQRMVWKEALGRRSKLSPSCSGCSSLSNNEFAEPFMAPLPARPVPSLSSVRCRPASSRKFLTFPSGKPLRGWRRYGGARRGRGAGLRLRLRLLPRGGSRGGGSAALPALGSVGQGRAGGLRFPSLPGYPSPGRAEAGAAAGKPVPCGWTGGSHRGVTCLWS